VACFWKLQDQGFKLGSLIFIFGIMPEISGSVLCGYLRIFCGGGDLVFFCEIDPIDKFLFVGLP
jgi:hypothetical protein